MISKLLTRECEESKCLFLYFVPPLKNCVSGEYVYIYIYVYSIYIFVFVAFCFRVIFSSFFLSDCHHWCSCRAYTSLSLLIVMKHWRRSLNELPSLCLTLLTEQAELAERCAFVGLVTASWPYGITPAAARCRSAWGPTWRVEKASAHTVTSGGGHCRRDPKPGLITTSGGNAPEMRVQYWHENAHKCA